MHKKSESLIRMTYLKLKKKDNDSLILMKKKNGSLILSSEKSL